MISTIITTYNRLDNFIRAFESVRNQTYQPKEIIVVDDCSENKISRLIKSYLPKNINYIKHNKNRGLAAARNTGLYQANEELVAYLDDDDVWLPGRLEAQINFLNSLPAENNNLACIQVGAQIIGRNDSLLDIYLPFNEGNLKDSIINYGTGTISSCFLFIKQKLIDVGGFDEKLISGIDDDIWMSLAESGYSNGIINKPFVQIFQDENQGMMIDTNHRIKGLNQYLDKWSPTIYKWFGKSGGKNYINKYFISSVGMLASEKIAVGDFRSSYFALKSIIKYIGINNYFNLLFTFYFIIKVFFTIRFPRVTKIIKTSILYEGKNTK